MAPSRYSVLNRPISNLFKLWFDSMNMTEQANPREESNKLANYLLRSCSDRGELLTPLKLQKLMFYADAWHMVIFDTELTSEKFQAWVHGPVALTQYHRFKEYKWKPISEDVQIPRYPEETINFLEEIVDIFGSEPAVALEMMTHQELPWIEARKGLADDEPCSNYISKDTTKKFYGEINQEDSEIKD